MTETEFRDIVSSTKRCVLGAIRRNLSAALMDLIDDVAQETYLRLYKYVQKHGLDSGSPEDGRLCSLAYVIARNESLRMNRRHRHVLLELPEELPDRQQIKNFELQGSLDAALSLLDQDLQPVMQLTSQGLTTEEIGIRLGIPAGTVKSRMHRARKRLRERLNEWFG